jgi:hypothetical protein
MTDDASPENLRKFLESDDPAMVRMGISLAKGAGVEITVKDLEALLKNKNREIVQIGFTFAAENDMENKVVENILFLTSDEMDYDTKIEIIGSALDMLDWKEIYHQIEYDDRIEDSGSGNYTFKKIFWDSLKWASKEQEILHWFAGQDREDVGRGQIIKAIERLAEMADSGMNLPETVDLIISASYQDKVYYAAYRALFDVFFFCEEEDQFRIAKHFIENSRFGYFEDIKEYFDETEILIEVLQQSNYLEWPYGLPDRDTDIITKLGEIGDKRAVEPITIFLKSNGEKLDLIQQKAAKEALRKLGHEVE